MTGIKKKVSKVLLSSTMILIMACSIVPINVLAEETNDGPSKEGKEITQSINIPQVKSLHQVECLI